MYKQIALNRNRTIFLMVLVFVILVGLGYTLSYIYDDNTILVVAVAVSVAMTWMSYFASDKIALATSRARPIRPDESLQERKILNLVENLSITAGLPVPQVYIIDDPAPNAFATGRDPKHASIALTRGLIDRLEKVELEGVIAHELAHIKNYDILLATVVITLVGAITLLGDWFLRGRLIKGSSGSREGNNLLVIVGIIFIVLSPIFARLIQLAVSRRREYLADASGAMLTRYPEGLASALKKIAGYPEGLRTVSRATAHLFISDPFGKMKKGFVGLFATHPPIEERIKVLEGMNL